MIYDMLKSYYLSSLIYIKVNLFEAASSSSKMHPHILLRSATFFFLLSLTTAFAARTTVLDTNCRPLLANTNCHILPATIGGGLTLLPLNDTASCPLYVGQDLDEISGGLPLKFFPSDPKQKHIPSFDLNIEFDAANICATSAVWSLAFDGDSGRRLVGTGGEVGNPGVGTLGNWFKIEKAESPNDDGYYNIVYCPSVCPSCRLFCGQLGVFVAQDGRRLLAFSDKPLLVRFKRA